MSLFESSGLCVISSGKQIDASEEEKKKEENRVRLMHLDERTHFVQGGVFGFAHLYASTPSNATSRNP